MNISNSDNINKINIWGEGKSEEKSSRNRKKRVALAFAKHTQKIPPQFFCLFSQSQEKINKFLIIICFIY